MSRAYKITMVTASSSVTHEDHMDMDLCPMEILPKAEMLALVREELRGEGWKDEADGSMSNPTAATPTSLSADGKTVTVRASAAQSVTAKGTDSEKATEALTKDEEKTKALLQAATTERLLAAEAPLKASMGEVLKRVYLKAIKAKAASMGNIESLVEGRSANGDYEVSIKVRT